MSAQEGFPWRAYTIRLRLASLCHERSAILSQKVCRKYQQDMHNRRNFRGKVQHLSGQRYGSEIRDAANLSDNVTLQS